MKIKAKESRDKAKWNYFHMQHKYNRISEREDEE